jgi:hypothetical protein
MNNNQHEINQTTLSYNAKEFKPQMNLSDIASYQTEDDVLPFEDAVDGEQGFEGNGLYPMNSYDPYHSWGDPMNYSSWNHYPSGMYYPLPYNYYPPQSQYLAQGYRRPSNPNPISFDGQRAVEYNGCVYYQHPSHVYERMKQVNDDVKKKVDACEQLPGYEYDSDDDFESDFDYLMMIENHPIYDRSDL